MQTDFTQLYSRLGLKPDCSLHEFKQAYRRRFAQLHPDRRDACALPPEVQTQLREIIAIYGSALSFHRRYGRLPGAPPSAVSLTTSSVSMPAPGSLLAVRTDASISIDEPSLRPRWGAVGLLVTSFVLVLLVSWERAPPTPEEAAQLRVRADRSAAVNPRAIGRIALGMDAATVLALQGEPARVRGTTWEYGPSWLRFENGRLVDWYSSPLRRLRTAAATPEPAINARHARTAPPRPSAAGSSGRRESPGS